MLANFDPANWSQVWGIGPGFYSFPILNIAVTLAFLQIVGIFCSFKDFVNKNLKGTAALMITIFYKKALKETRSVTMKIFRKII